MDHKKLEAMFNKKVDELGAAFQKFPWEKEAAYAAWLSQTYYFVRHTTTLVAMSAAKFGAKNREEHYQMIHHLADERGHDLLALTDLKNLGWKLEQVPEYAETSVFYQNQYYMISHEPAASHLGYSLVLEGLAAKYAPDVCKRITAQYGADCCEFANVHATVDQDHYASGLAELYKLTEEQAEAAYRNLEQSCLMYKMILDRIVATTAGKMNQVTNGSNHQAA